MTVLLSYTVVLLAVVITVGAGVILAPESAVQIIGFGVLVAPLIINLIQGAAAANKVADAAVKVEKVAQVAEAQAGKVDMIVVTTGNTQRQAEAIHTLVNSATGLQLTNNAVMARRLADITKLPADYEAAELAEKAANEHRLKQAVVDAGPSPAATVSGKAEE